jgi:protein gp37
MQRGIQSLAAQKISAGCDHCYAERFSERFRGTPGHPFENGFDLTLKPERLGQPLRWREPRMIFVNLMSDLFHKHVPKEFIERACNTMERAHWHTFQILTKRSSLMRDFLRRRYGESRGPSHMWFGVSVEDGNKKIRLAPFHLKLQTLIRGALPDVARERPSPTSNHVWMTK